jgi:hypothetical protein
MATVNYDAANGNVFLSNFHFATAASSAIAEPQSLLLALASSGALTVAGRRRNKQPVR